MRLALDPKYYEDIRNKVLDASLQTVPRRHPLWDLERHVANLERGFTEAWDNYLSGKPARHIFVKDIYDFPE